MKTVGRSIVWAFCLKKFALLTLLGLMLILTIALPAAWGGAPLNDNFADAVAISGSTGSITGSNVGATHEANEQDIGYGASTSVWYVWTAPGTGYFGFDTHGSDFNTVLGVFTGTIIDQLTQITINDDDGSLNNTSSVGFFATFGISYYIRVDGYSGASGNIALHWYPTTSSISGTVFEADGITPVRHSVDIEAYTGTSCSSLSFKRFGQSSITTGKYTIPGLPAGTYYLKTRSYGHYYCNEWYGPPQGVWNCADAQSLEVPGSCTITGVDFQLDPPLTISGTIYESDGITPITGKDIWVIAYTGSPCGKYTRAEYAENAVINSTTGTYTITGLSPGTYYLQIYGNEWWASPKSAWNCADAQSVTVVSGQTVTGMDFQLNPYPTISGTIFEADGVTPVTGKDIWVDAYTESPCGNHSRRSTYINSGTGTYTISNLPLGTYYLQTRSYENHLSEWWASPKSVLDCAGAQTIAFVSGQNLTGMDFQLDTCATISGTVFESDGITPITGKDICVDAYSGSPCSSHQTAGYACINSTNGTFTISGLLPGTYYLQTDTGYLDEWWASPQSVMDCAGAQSITVVASQNVIGKNFQLDIGATISGTVFESEGITPITGKDIYVDAYSGSPCSSSNTTFVTSAYVNSTNGTFAIIGLLPGTYYLQTSTEENYLSEWWASPQSVRTCGSAQAIVLTEGQSVIGYNFQLDPGATVSGTVYQSDGVTPITEDNIWITAYSGSSCGNPSMVGYTFTDSSTGSYTIIGLPPGPCFLQTTMTDSYQSEWWATPISSWRCSGAQSIDVVGTENITEKNFQLTRSDSIRKGDINGDGSVDLADLIEVLQILTGKNIEVMSGTDVNQDGKTGMEEAIYILQVVAGLRQ